MPARMTLKSLPLSDTTKKRLLADPGVAGVVLYYTPTADEDVKAAAFGPGCASKSLAEIAARLPDHFAFWERGQPTHDIAEQGRTAIALHMIDECPGLPPYTAAKTAGVDPSAIYRALKAREAKAAKPRCQCCGRPLAALQEVGA